jgi:hypothetical protein
VSERAHLVPVLRIKRFVILIVVHSSLHCYE